jgi:hypothetical protein
MTVTAAYLFADGPDGPDNPNSAIVIGTIQAEAKNYEDYGGSLQINGVMTAGVDLTFKDMGTDENIFAKSSGGSGLFYFNASAGHKYMLIRLHYLTSTEEHKAWIEVINKPVTFIRIGAESGVNFLGHINWVDDKNARPHSTVTLEKNNSEAIKNSFLETYPNTAWDMNSAPLIAKKSPGPGIIFRPIVAYDFAGTLSASDSATVNGISYSGSQDFDTKSGFGVGGEILFSVTDNLKLGGGFQYGLNRSISSEDSSNPEFSIIPIYGLISCEFALGGVAPYVIGRVGYSFLNGNDDFTLISGSDLNGGIYFSIGGGISIKTPIVSPFVELTYVYSKGSFEYPGYAGGVATDITRDVTYKRLQACVGVSFTI